MSNIENTLIDRVTDLLLKLNEKESVLTIKEIKDHIEDKDDYRNILNTMNERLAKIKTVINDNDELLHQLIRLHIDIMDVIWHFEEIHNALKKIIGRYDFIDKDKYSSVSIKEDL